MPRLLQPLEAHDGIEPSSGPRLEPGPTQLRQIAGLSRLSCVADFRIANVFTRRGGRSFPAVRHKNEKGVIPLSGAPSPGWRAEWDSNPLPPGCAAGAHPHVLPARMNGGRTDRPLIQLSSASLIEKAGGTIM